MLPELLPAACLPACLPVANCMVLYLMKDGCPSLAAFMAGCVQNNLHNHCTEGMDGECVIQTN